MNQKHYYTTSDIYISAYILCKGGELQRVDRTDPKRVKFITYHKDDPEAYANEYLSGRETRFVPMRYITALKTLKMVCYDNSHAKSSETGSLSPHSVRSGAPPERGLESPQLWGSERRRLARGPSGPTGTLVIREDKYED